MNNPYSRYCKYCHRKNKCRQIKTSCTLLSYVEGFEDGYDQAMIEVERLVLHKRLHEFEKEHEV